MCYAIFCALTALLYAFFDKIRPVYLLCVMKDNIKRLMAGMA